MAVSETLWQLVIGAPLAFLLGLTIGFVLSDRYRITRRNGRGPDDRTRPDGADEQAD
jgi:hypothetical protein